LIAGDDHGAKFGITYTLGNVIALCGCGWDRSGSAVNGR
jgi:hypothetical protein